jgi:unsaturated rhamnogalacturonyl hydrolase
MIDSTGNILTYRLDEHNIDQINAGKPLFQRYRQTGNEKFRTAIFTLREQMKTHPRLASGGFWHKAIYPHQMWLDGIYMGSPFLAQFAVTFDEPTLLDDVANQILLMEKYARDEKTGLLYHGYDDSRAQRWADPVTGLSPHFWGRGIGWYAMAIVDVLDFMPESHPKRPEIIDTLKRLAIAIANFQHPETGRWYQVMNEVKREGNYAEATASCMFVYALKKAAKQGYIDPAYHAVAKKGYDGILKHFIEVEKSGLVNLKYNCAGAGLGGNPYRDGSYEYYIHTAIRDNDPKGVGPFILASLEFESNE